MGVRQIHNIAWDLIPVIHSSDVSKLDPRILQVSRFLSWRWQISWCCDTSFVARGHDLGCWFARKAEVDSGGQALSTQAWLAAKQHCEVTVTTPHKCMVWSASQSSTKQWTSLPFVGQFRSVEIYDLADTQRSFVWRLKSASSPPSAWWNEKFANSVDLWHVQAITNGALAAYPQFPCVACTVAAVLVKTFWE